jgi:hypothetical protein
MLIFRAHKSTCRKVLVWPLTRTAARELASGSEAKKGPTPKGWPECGHKKMANPEGLATMSQAEKKKA